MRTSNACSIPAREIFSVGTDLRSSSYTISSTWFQKPCGGVSRIFWPTSPQPPNIHPDSFRDAASLAQLVTTFAAERPETDEKVLQALQEHVEGYHQSAKRDCHAEEPLTEAARGIQNLFRLTDAEREALLLLYAVSQFEAFETVWTSHRPMSG